MDIKCLLSKLVKFFLQVFHKGRLIRKYEALRYKIEILTNFKRIPFVYQEAKYIYVELPPLSLRLEV
ncbi:hypothetical protein, partial [Bacillus cereus]|uniref:hypothetical protein n=1 Tax=Bacillus cereus TaxID=1396 RepID=UPI0019D697BB